MRSMMREDLGETLVAAVEGVGHVEVVRVRRVGQRVEGAEHPDPVAGALAVRDVGEVLARPWRAARSWSSQPGSNCLARWADASYPSASSSAAARESIGSPEVPVAGAAAGHLDLAPRDPASSTRSREHDVGHRRAADVAEADEPDAVRRAGRCGQGHEGCPGLLLRCRPSHDEPGPGADVDPVVLVELVPLPGGHRGRRAADRWPGRRRCRWRTAGPRPTSAGRRVVSWACRRLTPVSLRAVDVRVDVAAHRGPADEHALRGQRYDDRQARRRARVVAAPARRTSRDRPTARRPTRSRSVSRASRPRRWPAAQEPGALAAGPGRSGGRGMRAGREVVAAGLAEQGGGAVLGRAVGARLRLRRDGRRRRPRRRRVPARRRLGRCRGAAPEIGTPQVSQ